MPNLRQYGGYTCGDHLRADGDELAGPYQADWNLTAYEEELGTNEEAGTPPGSIVSFFEENKRNRHGMRTEPRQNWLRLCTRGTWLLCIQAWAAAEDGYNTQNSDDADTYLAEGHWVICRLPEAGAGLCILL